MSRTYTESLLSSIQGFFQKYLDEHQSTLCREATVLPVPRGS